MGKYIPLDALVAEIESRIKSMEECFNGKFPMSQSVKETEQDKGKLVVYKSILSFLNTLEVKEVDYDKEVTEYLNNFENANIGHRLSLRRCAKYFFELGLKVQKGK